MTRLFFAVLGIFILFPFPVSNASTLQYRYDELDRLYQMEYGDGTTVIYVYDNVGNRIALRELTLSANPTSPQAIGALVTFTGSASGGSGTYEYEFWGRLVGAPTWSPAQGYSTNNSWTWNTATVAAGNYEFKVNTRSVGSTETFEATQTIPYTLFILPATGVTLTPSSAGPQAPGTPVTWTADAEGGSGSYEYQIWFFNGAWSIVKDYNVPGNSWNWNTTGLADGTYYVTVYARSVGSTSPVEAVANMPYTLATPSAIPPATGVTLTPSPSGPQAPGTPVTWTAVAEGGSGSYEYQIWFFNGAWSIVKDYNVPGNSWNWNTTGLSVGTYHVTVYARSAGSTSPVEAVANMPYTLQ